MFDGQLIGVDVGGTKVAVATLEDARLGESLVRPTDASSADGLVDEIVASIEEVRSSRTVAVGVGVPSVVEFATGRIRSSTNLELEDVDLRMVLAERLGLPVFVDNDATVAALAEAFDDAGRPIVQNLVMFTVGTGIGGGLVLNGRVYRGTTGAAGELGHTLVGVDLAAGVPPAGEFPQPGSLGVPGRRAGAGSSRGPDRRNAALPRRSGSWRPGAGGRRGRRCEGGKGRRSGGDRGAAHAR